MPQIKVEVKEENIYGDDVLLARGRLKGALQELVEQSEDDNASSDEDSKKHLYRSPGKKQMYTFHIEYNFTTMIVIACLQEEK